LADRYCGNCGRELTSSSGYCPSCGRTSRLTVGPLAREREQQASPRRPSGEPGTRAGSRGAGRALMLSVVACLLLAAVWAVLRFGPGLLGWLLDG
jgi:hypothetical protein